MDEQASRTLRQLEKALPTSEFRALWLWLGTFYAYQRNWILDPYRFALLVKARQIGASHSYAAWAILRGLLGELTTVISVGQREADEVIEKSGKHAAALVRFGSRWAAATGTSSLRLASGGRILSLPATSGGRSYSGNVILDEAAYYQNPEKVWDGAGAVVMHGGSLRVLSTPNGVGNLFYDLVTNPKARKGYRLHRVTIDQAIADGLRVDMPSLWAMARNDPRVFDQLFRCVFLGREEASVVSQDAIKAAKQRWALLDDEGTLDIGVDPARFGDDESVIYWRRGLKLRGPTVAAHADGAAVAALVLRVISEEYVKGEALPRVKVDTIGVGASVVDQLRPFDGELLELHAVNVSEAASDEEKFTNLRAEIWFEAADWLLNHGGIDESDVALEREFLTPQFSFDPKRRFRVESKDEVRKRLRRSPDRADAAILCIHEPQRMPIRAPALIHQDGYRLADTGRGFG